MVERGYTPRQVLDDFTFRDLRLIAIAAKYRDKEQ